MQPHMFSVPPEAEEEDIFLQPGGPRDSPGDTSELGGLRSHSHVYSAGRLFY